eukprot:11335128-Prorocentrum_lima.AAC.1
MSELSYKDPKRVESCDHRLVATIDRKQRALEASPGGGLHSLYFSNLATIVHNNPAIPRAADWVATLGGHHTG